MKELKKVVSLRLKPSLVETLKQEGEALGYKNFNQYIEFLLDRRGETIEEFCKKFGDGREFRHG